MRDAPQMGSEKAFGPGFPAKVWFMVFCQNERLLRQALSGDMPTVRSDGEGNKWHVSEERGQIVVRKHVNKVRIEAAETEIASIRNGFGQALQSMRNRRSEWQRRKNDRLPPAEVEDARMEFEVSYRGVMQMVQRHEQCRELINTSETRVFVFPSDALETLMFGDVPIDMRTGPGPKLDCPSLATPQLMQELGMEEVDDEL